MHQSQALSKSRHGSWADTSWATGHLLSPGSGAAWPGLSSAPAKAQAWPGSVQTHVARGRGRRRDVCGPEPNPRKGPFQKVRRLSGQRRPKPGAGPAEGARGLDDSNPAHGNGRGRREEDGRTPFFKCSLEHDMKAHRSKHTA